MENTGNRQALLKTFNLYKYLKEKNLHMMSFAYYLATQDTCLQEKQRNLSIQLTELAYTSGYYDQSHMINDYKLLSGKTPTQYFSECEPYSDYFQ